MGHNGQYIAGPLMTAAGAGLTATGGGSGLGIPLMTAGLGETTGGPRAGLAGGMLGGLGESAFPGAASGISNALGAGAEKMGLGQFVNQNPGAIAAALKSNPSLRGITPDMVMPDVPSSSAQPSAPTGQWWPQFMQAMGMI